ncbi:bifunctional precorrin-2 dehydrogenase/sirohydrochlorin ferrochelatase [Marinilongibacter aquaticus]|uniref:precorrin-2 dehydrogenase/sirohydrochlorin ferrochelatase family protein n=1 Tax=Marinilongibacter aquaticus TaxID=2975157 RepID=UPI0021BD5578|nr:bifunctional precorrin-2 dehydrogenase/sirohydrochlorin ferrochelatase [Marinilongibacter aquaticus]UBM57846.1 bifunctional precorrin-2 dehydrogenase/sirohydrochlorin ferrochelatase [Marinilongibacter aquaticus]
MNNLFPVFLKLEQMNLLIVGGGYVGLEKLEAVLKNAPNTHITLVAPEISEAIEALAREHDISLIFEEYKEVHLKNKQLVIVGTGIMEVSQQVQQDCREKGVLVNVADKPELCDFYLSSTVCKGDLKIAISTNGKSPTFAKRFREILEAILPDSLQETLDNLQAIRNSLKGNFEDKVERLNEITKVMKKENEVD